MSIKPGQVELMSIAADPFLCQEAHSFQNIPIPFFDVEMANVNTNTAPVADCITEAATKVGSIKHEKQDDVVADVTEQLSTLEHGDNGPVTLMLVFGTWGRIFAFVGMFFLSVAAYFDGVAIGNIGVYALSAFNRLSIEGALAVVSGVVVMGKSHNGLTVARP